MTREIYDSKLKSVWDPIFSAVPPVSVRTRTNLYSIPHARDLVFHVDDGAVVEIRSDGFETSHVVGLIGAGSLIGLRQNNGLPAGCVSAITLTDSSVRSVDRDVFISATLNDPQLTSSYISELARRVEMARWMCATCSHPSLQNKVVSLLETIAAKFGVSPNGEANVGVGLIDLEKMTGTPQGLLRLTILDLAHRGLIRNYNEVIRWKT